MVKKKFIGSTFMVTYNGQQFSGTITDDPTQWDYYKTIGLDIFTKTEREELEEKLDAMGVKYKKNWKLETLKEKYDSANKGTGEY